MQYFNFKANKIQGKDSAEATFSEQSNLTKKARTI